MCVCRSDELIEMYKAFTKDFPVISIEDPFDQDDIEHSQKLTAEGVCQVRCSWLDLLCARNTGAHSPLV